MFEWLSSLPIWFQILFSCLLIIVILLVTFILYKIIFTAIKKGVNVTNDRKSLKIGDMKEQEIISAHQNCPNRSDAINNFNELIKLLHEKFVIQYSTQFKDQMNYAEQKADQIRAILQRIYIKELENRKVDKLVSSNSFNAYRLVLKDAESTILVHIRRSFRENHFDEMSEKEFNSYAADKFEFLLGESTECLNDLYFYQKDITREELYTLNQESINKIKELVIEMFQKARQISIDYKVKILEIDEAIEKILMKYV